MDPAAPALPFEASDPARAARDGFAAALSHFHPHRPPLIVSHFDADGLAAAAILARAFKRAGRAATVRILGEGETPWDEGVGREIAAADPGGLIVVDLGVRDNPLAGGVPTVLIDQHRPTGTPPGATVLTGHGLDPEPSSALIAWWAAHALADVDDLLWLAALRLSGGMADGFAEPERAQARWGKTAIRDAVTPVNTPRRTAAADPSPALRLLPRADGPKAIVRGDDTDAQALRAAKAEMAEAMATARRIAPRVRGDVALIPLSSPCQIHPLIAQSWRGRLKDKIVLAANRGYRDGWVHFAARSATGRDLIHFLAEHRPPGADGRYGNGHAQAAGGALRPADWNAFAGALGFPGQKVPA